MGNTTDLSKQLNLILNRCESINLQKQKLDALLIIVHHLLGDYKKMQLPSDELQKHFIYENIKSLKDYLDQNIITGQTLSYIFQNQNNSVAMKKISINLEPMRVYYKFLTSTFSSKLKKGSYWIPEILAFSLIHDFKKEFGKSFTQHQFIENFPVEKILEIYNKNNLMVKRKVAQEENATIWNVKTSLDEMYDVSSTMIKNYLEFNFKVNETRVSKTRKKKR